jgi:SpoVK/Ycf46/Vps4 family AAA+-type ATPase
VFDHDIKGELIWMMTNICKYFTDPKHWSCSPFTVKFSQRQERSAISQSLGHAKRDVSPLILLYGPPGTGKTTLCQALAQKISIRLNHTYKQTRLIQIKTSTLLSKYFSESAKQVDEIFTKLARMCEENKDEFFCVIIDEVRREEQNNDPSGDDSNF